MKSLDEIPELIGATAWINAEQQKQDLVGEKLTLVHFWSLSCYLCREAMPDIAALRDELKDELHVLAVHIPRSEDDLDVNEIKKTVKEYEITQPVFVDSQLMLADRFENKYVPAYYLFDQKGKLLHFQAGGSGMDILKAKINRYLIENKQNEAVPN